MNYLKQLWHVLFPVPTLKTVLSSFERTIVDLEGVIARNQTQVLDTSKQITSLIVERDRVRQDIDRASTVSKNIAALIKG